MKRGKGGPGKPGGGRRGPPKPGARPDARNASFKGSRRDAREEKPEGGRAGSRIGRNRDEGRGEGRKFGGSKPAGKFGGERKFGGGDRPGGDRSRTFGGRDDRGGDRPRHFRDKPEGGRGRSFGGEGRPPREGGEDRPRREGRPAFRSEGRGFRREGRPPREGGEDRPRKFGGPKFGGERKSGGRDDRGDRPRSFKPEGGRGRSFGGEGRPPREGGEDRPRKFGGPKFGGERKFGGRDDRGDRPRSFKPEGGRGRSFGGEDRPRRFDDKPAGARAEGQRFEGKRFESKRPAGKRPAAKRGDFSFKAPVFDDSLHLPPSAEGAAPKTFKSSGTVQIVTVTADENDMRIDRFFEARFPGLSFSHIQRIIRKGEVRIDGKRAGSKDRLSAGQQVRIPPLQVEPPPPRDDAPSAQQDRAFIKSITLYEDDDVMVLNKPMGLAVQGGSGTVRHIDGMLGALRGSHPDAQRPRLVHRIDKDTAGCLLVAKTRFAAAALAKTFRSRSARKVYWALVVGVPKPRQGRISTYLAKEENEEDSIMRVADHGDDGAMHAVTYYAVVETAAQKLAWLSLKPVTGRTHQLRAHTAHIGHPIVGDPKYFNIENWELPGGIQNRLHLLARRISVPHPRGGVIDVSAPLPPHMEQSWNLLGFDAARYDPIEDAPEEE